ncbi:MAG: phosphoethanolamine transferase [Phascolarctobacterium sp.]|nr:phosphoethanolamine transferase [Candidatus Phascolarctobacterium caballi]
MYLALCETNEVLRVGASMVSELLVPVLWGVCECLFLITISKFVKVKKYTFDIAWLCLIIFISGRSFSTKQEHGIFCKPAYGRVKACYFATGYFLGHMVPFRLFNLGNLPMYTCEEPAKITEPMVRNVVFIMGESESASHVNVFGYERNTSPFLMRLSKQDDAVVKQSYSAGFMTAVSVPTIFNAVPWPNGQQHINQGNTNLLRLAKEQGFETFYFSAHAENDMNIIQPIGKRWIDNLTFPTTFGCSIEDPFSDNNLVDQFDKIDFSRGKKFVVLQQRGSHGPYGSLLTEKEKEIFGGGNRYDLYDDTIYATDKLIQKIYDKMQAAGVEDWLLIYTSDHGQYVTKTASNQGTLHPECYIVPLAVVSDNQKVIQKAMDDFERTKISSHYQMGSFIIRMLGYDYPIADMSRIVVNSRTLDGESGYLEIVDGKERFIVPK